MNAWRLAVGTLTRFPSRPPTTVDARTAGRAMLLAPLTTLPPLVVLLLASWAVTAGRLPAYLAAVLVVAALAWWSRGLHLDGLADTADGLAASYDRERALDIMRRGNVGPNGVVTVVLVLLVQTAALTSAPAGLAATALVASRLVLPLLCRRGVPAARPEGLGATVAGTVPPAPLAAVWVVALGGSVLVSPIRYAGPLVLLAAGLAALAVERVARRRLGGITGDVLGTGVELSLAVALVASLALIAAGP